MPGKIKKFQSPPLRSPNFLIFPGIPLQDIRLSTACYNRPVPAETQLEIHELLAVATDAGTRLDRFVAAHCTDLSRSRVQELIEAGLLLVNGKPAKASQKLRGGELITVQVKPRPALHAEAQAIPLDVLYEDEDVVAVN